MDNTVAPAYLSSDIVVHARNLQGLQDQAGDHDDKAAHQVVRIVAMKIAVTPVRKAQIQEGQDHHTICMTPAQYIPNPRDSRYITE